MLYDLSFSSFYLTGQMVNVVRVDVYLGNYIRYELCNENTDTSMLQPKDKYFVM